ncbi:MAG: DUF805 domain-containing protein [Candidatus Hydrogenedentes bacterium]|nr:DUF805 domain-containing protein [Candidatus Hydrogenedentota bacterium]
MFAPFYWYYIVLKKYVVFKGRARRKEYWYFWLVNIILFLFSGLISGEDGGLMACYFIAVFLPSVAVSFRRLHDIGRSGWWFFILFIPWVGVVFYFIFMVLNSQQKTNVYGENPKALIAYKNAD